MSDGKKSCLGFGFLVLGLGLAALALLAGGVGEMIAYFGGKATGLSFKLGFYVGLALLALSFLLSAILFISVKNWAWLPAIAGGVYTVLPDLILGPEDDAVAMFAGVALSSLMAFLRTRSDKRMAAAALDLPDDLD